MRSAHRSWLHAFNALDLTSCLLASLPCVNVCGSDRRAALARRRRRGGGGGTAQGSAAASALVVWCGWGY